MQRKKTFLVVCISILIAIRLPAQTPGAAVDKKIADHLEWTRPAGVLFHGSGIASYSSPPAPLLFPPAKASATLPPIQAVGGEYYTQHLGFFCKKELDFIKVTHIPLHFRLGDLQYVDHLEGK